MINNCLIIFTLFYGACKYFLFVSNYNLSFYKRNWYDKNIENF
ncbi:hypothetical protein HMPREF0083_03072 [Aneurinibacillus aneurinilyticus ATCC 12856]|uniref:Uncharacterized protein n=1 Tax=Aneurinibacillus aneurinilyticus ATCC 12856 TaxID=649747 RepID=U1YDJ9_ANEAE|nr:hypothetical protein HMPREF0083_03072 [Aneurinibacillus aneurinilyticus ATCC 12856]